MGFKIEGSAARLGRSRLSEKFRDRRLAARLRRVGRDGLGDPKNLGIGSLAGTGRTARYRLPKNLGVVGSAGTDQTGRFRHSIYGSAAQQCRTGRGSIENWVVVGKLGDLKFEI